VALVEEGLVVIDGGVGLAEVDPALPDRLTSLPTSTQPGLVAVEDVVEVMGPGVGGEALDLLALVDPRGPPGPGSGAGGTAGGLA